MLVILSALTRLAGKRKLADSPGKAAKSRMAGEKARLGGGGAGAGSMEGLQDSSDSEQ